MSSIFGPQKGNIIGFVIGLGTRQGVLTVREAGRHNRGPGANPQVLVSLHSASRITSGSPWRMPAHSGYDDEAHRRKVVIRGGSVSRAELAHHVEKGVAKRTV